jgi:hypothetical protein
LAEASNPFPPFAHFSSQHPQPMIVRLKIAWAIELVGMGISFFGLWHLVGVPTNTSWISLAPAQEAINEIKRLTGRILSLPPGMTR